MDPQDRRRTPVIIHPIAAPALYGAGGDEGLITRPGLQAGSDPLVAARRGRLSLILGAGR